MQVGAYRAPPGSSPVPESGKPGPWWAVLAGVWARRGDLDRVGTHGHGMNQHDQSAPTPGPELDAIVKALVLRRLEGEIAVASSGDGGGSEVLDWFSGFDRATANICRWYVQRGSTFVVQQSGGFRRPEQRDDAATVGELSAYNVVGRLVGARRAY